MAFFIYLENWVGNIEQQEHKVLVYVHVREYRSVGYLHRPKAGWIQDWSLRALASLRNLPRMAPQSSKRSK